MGEHWFALFDDDKVRNPTHTKSRGDLRILVGVDFDDEGASAEFFRDVDQEGRGGFARATPWRPEIDENRLFGIRQNSVERRHVDLERRFDGSEFLFAGAAPARVGELSLGDAVLFIAVGTGANHLASKTRHQG